MKILGRLTSINVRKVLWTADELGLAYEREDWGLPLRDPQQPEFLRLNPNGQVPVLVEGGFVLWESNAIMRHLAEASPLIPADRQARALMEQWLGWQATELAPTWLYAFRALVWKSPGFDDRQQIARSEAQWTARMRLLDAALADGRRFVAGDGFSLADIALAVAIHRWMNTPLERPPLDHAEAYYRRLGARPAGARYLTAETP